MTHSIKNIALALSLFLVTFGAAQATPIYIETTASTSNVSINITESVCPLDFACPTIAHEFAADLTGNNATLSDSGSWTFNFFDLIVGGIGAATGTIEATLGFTSPEALATSSGSGGFASIPVPMLGIVSAGTLQWGPAGQISLGDGTWLSVEFSDIFALGLGNRATVQATVSRYTRVPEPGTLALFGIALLGLGVVGQRRQHG